MQSVARRKNSRPVDGMKEITMRYFVRCVCVCSVWLAGVAVLIAADLTQDELDRGIVPKPGDSVILRDFSKLTPQNALSTKSTRVKWWLRPYTEANGGPDRVMLMTVQRDMDRPESCLVPRVTYPLALRGWYAVWIATYRGPYGGGIDAKLSGDDCFVHINPQQVELHSKRPKPRTGVVVEVNYKPAADLTGQSLDFQQPYGSYESFHWGFCEASLAYIRLVRLSDEQVAAFKADQTNNDRRRIAIDDDNMSRYWQWGGRDAQDILRIYEDFRYHDILFHGLCLGGSTSLKVPTPYSDVEDDNGQRLGDKRIRTLYRDLLAKGVDMLQLAAQRAHKYGIKVLPTLRMSVCYSPGPHFRALSGKYHLKGTYQLDFAYPQVRDHLVRQIRYILEKYDVDGFMLDFTRHCVYFNPDEPRKNELMNAFSAQMRKMVDEVGAKKGKKLLLAAEFSEAAYVSGFMKNYLKVDVKPEERLAYQGIDPAAWVRNGYYDIIIPEGKNIEKYIAMTRGTTTRCFPRWEFGSTLHTEPLAAGGHDPTPAEDKTDRPVDAHNGPRDIEAGWLQLCEKGADGVYLFNNELSWNTWRRLGHLDEVRTRVAAGAVDGLIEGPAITFVDKR
jgi:hypothetical protein